MKNRITDRDIFYMQAAIAESRKKSGLTNPNPSVGAVIVKGERIFKAATASGGRPHAEAAALKKAGRWAEGADVYVTLEPCSHFGVTPPCAARLIHAHVRRVFIAVKDPNPLVNGKGIRMLRRAGIEVVTNVLKKEAAEVNEWFFKTFQSDMPYVVLKSAVSADGKIATHTGHSQWISSPASLKFAHQLRQTFDAVIAGTDTVRADNPTLNVRLPSVKHLPDKVILDRKGVLDENLNIFQRFAHERIFYFYHQKRKIQFKNQEILSFRVPVKHGRLDLKAVLRILKQHHIYSLLSEGGGALNGTFIDEGLADKIIFIIAPKIIGGRQAVPVVGGTGAEKLDEALLLQDVSIRASGRDYIYTGFIKRYC